MRDHLITTADSAYPEKLRLLKDAPATLYTRGQLNGFDRPCVAIVGSRGASRAKRAIAHELARSAVINGYCVISGGALGIDAAAHQGAIDAGGATVAFLGSGLDQLYPPRNRPLFDRIIRAGGALITPFAPGQRPLRWHFPRRNRLIAACAELVVVVEADARSGALNTVRHARDLGVDVAAVTGSPGAARVLSAGAARIDGGADLLKKLSGAALPLPPPSDPDERAILQILRNGDAALDALAKSCGLPAATTAGALIRLEIDGRIEPLLGGRYRALD